MQLLATFSLNLRYLRKVPDREHGRRGSQYVSSQTKDDAIKMTKDHLSYCKRKEALQERLYPITNQQSGETITFQHSNITCQQWGLPRGGYRPLGFDDKHPRRRVHTVPAKIDDAETSDNLNKKIFIVNTKLHHLDLPVNPTGQERVIPHRQVTE